MLVSFLRKPGKVKPLQKQLEELQRRIPFELIAKLCKIIPSISFSIPPAFNLILFSQHIYNFSPKQFVLECLSSPVLYLEQLCSFLIATESSFSS